jgi:hypothetical protein
MRGAETPMKPRYFASDDRRALYRLGLEGRLVGEYRRCGAWMVDEDIVRRYWNGFDADVTECTEAPRAHNVALPGYCPVLSR